MLDAASVACLDVTAADMLDQAAEDLRSRGVALLVARDIGEVRDVLRHTEDGQELQLVYRSVQAAVDAAERGSSCRRGIPCHSPRSGGRPGEIANRRSPHAGGGGA
jgi:hypothetical protein